MDEALNAGKMKVMMLYIKLHNWFMYYCLVSSQPKSYWWRRLASYLLSYMVTVIQGFRG